MLKEAIEIVDRYIKAPEKPVLGIEINDESIEKYRQM